MENKAGILADISTDADLEIFWWIDWASTDQDAPGPDMAALPAFAAACAGIVAAWSPEYASRAWCQVELLMAHAFMTTGRLVLVVPDGFAGAEPQGGKWVTREEVAVADPAAGQLTNDHDRAVIRSLTGVAERSTAFSCWRVFVKHSTESVLMCCFWNVCCCCQWCGLVSLIYSRKVRPGQSTVEKVLPVGATTAPAQQAMQREELPLCGDAYRTGGMPNVPMGLPVEPAVRTKSCAAASSSSATTPMPPLNQAYEEFNGRIVRRTDPIPRRSPSVPGQSAAVARTGQRCACLVVPAAQLQDVVIGRRRATKLRECLGFQLCSERVEAPCEPHAAACTQSHPPLREIR